MEKLDPLPSAWTPWTQCDVTCGVGTKRKTRTCLDFNTKEDLTQSECFGHTFERQEKCDGPICPGKIISHRVGY